MQMNFDLSLMRRLLFISPHHDDMIYSCGGVVKKLLHNNINILNINIFSLSDWSTIEGISKEKISLIRKSEEQKIAREWGFDTIDLDFPDSSKRGLNVVEELSSEIDISLLLSIRNRLFEMITDVPYDVVFLPRAIGNHIDHLYAFNLSTYFSSPIVFYEDLPYSFFYNHLEDFRYNEVLLDVTEYYDDKLLGIYNYQSQLETKNVQAIIDKGKGFVDDCFIERVWV